MQISISHHNLMFTFVKNILKFSKGSNTLSVPYDESRDSP